MKKAVLILFALLGLSFLFAEGKSEGESGEKKPVELTMSIWGNETHQKMYQGLLDRAKETHPHISSEVVLIPFKEYQQKMSILVAADEAPTIAWLAESMLPQFMDADNLKDISGIKADSAYNFDDFIPATLELVSKDGKLYGLPFSTPPGLLYWNKTLFEEKGLESPVELAKRGEWNYDNFMKAIIALTDKDQGVFGFNSNLSSGSFIQIWSDFLWGYGGEWWNGERTEFTLNSPAGVKAYQLLSDMVLKYEGHPKPGDQVAFEAGKVGMYQMTLRYMSNAREITDFEWSICPFPQGPAGKNVKMGYAAYTVMNDEYDDDDIFAALKAVTDQTAYQTTAQFFVPCRESVLSSPDFLSNYEPVSEEDAKITIIDSLKSGRILDGHKNLAQISMILDAGVESMLLGETTPEETVELMEKEIQPLMQ